MERELGEGISELAGENDELKSGIEADISHNFIDKNFLNMIAARIHAEL